MCTDYVNINKTDKSCFDIAIITINNYDWKLFR